MGGAWVCLRGVREVFRHRSEVSLEQLKKVLHAYRQHVRKQLLGRELAWWEVGMERLDPQMLIPYSETKQLPAPFEQAVSSSGRWTARLQHGVAASSQLRAGAALLRGGTRGNGPNLRWDKRCIFWVQARGAAPMPIAEETVVHVVGECRALDGPRSKFLDRRRGKSGRPDEPRILRTNEDRQDKLPIAT